MTNMNRASGNLLIRKKHQDCPFKNGGKRCSHLKGVCQAEKTIPRREKEFFSPFSAKNGIEKNLILCYKVVLITESAIPAIRYLFKQRHPTRACVRGRLVQRREEGEAMLVKENMNKKH